MPVIALENWTAVKTDSGSFIISCIQSQANIAKPFLIGHVETKNKKQRYEHRFIINKVLQSKNIFGWTAELYHKETKTRYTLVLGIKNQLRVRQTLPEKETTEEDEAVMVNSDLVNSDTADVESDDEESDDEGEGQSGKDEKENDDD
ncbi:MAG: hypothetical protein EBQ92_00415, partial [Proteobacteria bacterium]|nr:hypothetical protein [Pseudomonadota bacterium]